jgi:flavin-binding protein dodecin
MSEDHVGGVVKVIEVVGSSPSSFSDAVRNAVKVASKSVRHIQGVDVISSTADVDENGELANYKVHCKLAFLIEASIDGHEGDASGTVTASASGGASARGTSPGAR